jgi:3-hydroxyisobutyrate dehydrogenase-like beta-hydroxyacid dehydrogenase
MAQAHGLAPATLFEVLTNTVFASPIYKTYAPMIVERRYDTGPTGFNTRLGMKDVRLALEAGEEGNVPLAFGSVLRDQFIDAIAHGDAERDWTSVAKVTLRRAGLEQSSLARHA